ncbi:MAG: class I SAM-dependent methyltransferase [Planctomycetales bacterium]|nr:class I SAM-dependent methyltransferase [Planctomycetales bacterium]
MTRVCIASIVGIVLMSNSIFSDENEAIAEELPPARTSYMGRKIAQTMHYLGAPWLVRDSRQREEDCELMLSKLELKPGMVVCDMGCGNGFYTLQMASAVGENGKVLAVDIQPEMLRLMEARAAEEGIENVESILGTVADPKLPQGKVDLILCVDVYHEFSHPERMLRAMRESLKPDGVIALLEFRLEDRNVPIKLLHKMSKKQIMKEYPANGLKLVREFDELPWQHMMFFGRDENWKPSSKPDERE